MNTTPKENLFNLIDNLDSMVWGNLRDETDWHDVKETILAITEAKKDCLLEINWTVNKDLDVQFKKIFELYKNNFGVSHSYPAVIECFISAFNDVFAPVYLDKVHAGAKFREEIRIYPNHDDFLREIGAKLEVKPDDNTRDDSKQN